MRRLFLGLALAAMTATAHAGPYDAPDGYNRTYSPGEGVRVRDRVNGANVRLDVDCDLTIRGREPYHGSCNVGRRDRGRVTAINTGQRTYKIVRHAQYVPGEPDPVEADFYRDDEWIDTIFSDGDCWRGTKVTFCAR